MYDFSKRRECKNLQVWEAIAILCKMPLNALVLFNGDEYGYLHIEEDESAISFDDSSLDDEYEKRSSQMYTFRNRRNDHQNKYQKVCI